MFGRPPKPSALDEALLELVTDAVPRGSASMGREWDANARGWRVEVVPNNPEACPFALVVHARDQVRFEVGLGTRFEVYGVRRPNDLALVSTLVGALVAGEVEEFVSRSASYVRIRTGRRRSDVFEGGRRSRFWPGTPKPSRYAPFS